jgi:hypothetical protein
MGKHKHGEATSPATKEYRTWNHIKERCYQRACKQYKFYGARGIRMDRVWLHNYPKFLEHVGRAPSPKHSLQRIDNDGHYAPGNVIWATSIEQQNNKRSNRIVAIDGIIGSFASVCRQLGLEYKRMRGLTSRDVRTPQEAADHIRYGIHPRSFGPKKRS